MRAHVEVLCEKSGQRLAAAAIDTPPFGLTRGDTWEFVQILRKTRAQVEAALGYPVRLTIDSWESSVFWYLVLHRPLKFDDNHPLYGGTEKSVYELIQNKKSAEDLKMTDLGVFADLDNTLLVLYWPEAKKGICADFHTCKSWQEVIDDFKKRTGRDPDENFLEKCARSFAFTVPTWYLSQLDYPKKIFFKDKAKAKDFIALDLNGIDAPRLAVNGTLKMPATKHARFVHFYIDNEEEYKFFVARQSELHRKYGKKRRRLVQQARRRDMRRRENEQQRREEHSKMQVLFQITREVLTIMRALGVPFRGRPIKYLTPDKSDKFFSRAVESYINGDAHDIKWNRLQRSAVEIERLLLLKDSHVPDSFWKWTWWKDHAEKIHQELEKEW